MGEPSSKNIKSKKKSKPEPLGKTLKVKNELLKNVTKINLSKKDLQNEEEFKKADESELEEEIEESEDIRFKEISAFLKPLSGFGQGEIVRTENLERGVSGIRLRSGRLGEDEEGQEVSYKTSGQDDNNHYKEVKEEVVEYRTLDSGPERNIGLTRHDTGLEIGGNPWHRSDVKKIDDSVESMSQKARANYEVGDHRRESIFESQDRKYKLRK